MHEFGSDDHDHADSDSELESLIYRLDNVKLTTIGVDVGSSTFHLMFARVHLHRETQNLSSKFEVVGREILWQSEIGLTPYRGRYIDAEAVGEFVADGHLKAGLSPEDVDSGAVILTGEALRQHNARALADAIAAGSGKFVCVSAGHHIEAMLSAFGSGATDYTKQTGARLLHIDIGGGTTKLSHLANGQVLATASLMVGGRQVAWNEKREIISTTAGAKTIARAAGVDITVGTTFSPSDEQRFIAAQAEVIFAIANGGSEALGRKLRLTRVLPKGFEPTAVSFSGGVSEYVYGREVTEYGDLGAGLGRVVRAAIDGGKISLPVANPGEGIRATVVGASQCSVQLSGNTVAISDPGILPVHNIPVVHPEIRVWTDQHPLDPEEVSTAIKKAAATYGFMLEGPIALAFSWHGDPSFQRMAEFVRGIQHALSAESAAPAIVLMDDDVALSIGRLLFNEFPVARPVICLDGLELSPFDHVDVGTVLEPSGALPVVIKSLLFASD